MLELLNVREKSYAICHIEPWQSYNKQGKEIFTPLTIRFLRDILNINNPEI